MQVSVPDEMTDTKWSGADMWDLRFSQCCCWGFNLRGVVLYCWVFPKQQTVISQNIWTFQFWNKLDSWLGISYPERLVEACYSKVWTAGVVLRRLLQYVTLSWLSEHWRLCNETPEAVDTSEMNEYSAPVPNIKEFRLMILGGPLWLVFYKLF